ncbi:MAG: Cell division protein ZapA [Rickettsiaceae bacterium]|jgi:cell division protein ZapA (FtsZ GTPase activity inhibitor)|nr:Cell division protein ZapA [Rickettsiaceae bacterium]
MPIINLAIGKSKYVIDCAEGEEDKVVTMAERLNKRINDLSLASKNADEKTLLMICALMIEAELEAAQNNQTVSNKKVNKREESQASEESNEESKNIMADQFEDIAKRIQKLTGKISNL